MVLKVLEAGDENVFLPLESPADRFVGSYASFASNCLATYADNLAYSSPTHRRIFYRCGGNYCRHGRANTGAVFGRPEHRCTSRLLVFLSGKRSTSPRTT